MSTGDKQLGPKEQILWARYKLKYPDLARNAKNSFALIPPNENKNDEDKEYIKDWNLLKAPKIDAVSRDDRNNILIYEIRPVCKWNAISGVIAYEALYRTIMGYTGKVKKIIICETTDTMTKAVADKMHVEIIEI